MKYVTCKGYLYRLKDATYKDMLSCVAEGTCFAGEFLDVPSNMAENLGYVPSVTDLGRVEAAQLLEKEAKK